MEPFEPLVATDCVSSVLCSKPHALCPPLLLMKTKPGQKQRTCRGNTQNGRGTLIKNSVPVFFSGSWKSMVRIVKFFKVEFEDQSKLIVAKRVVQKLEEEITKLKEAKIRAVSQRREKIIGREVSFWR